MPRWVAWREEPRKKGGKPTKVPYCLKPNGGWSLAKTDDPLTWTSHDTAASAKACDGVGIVLTKFSGGLVWAL